MTSHRVVSRSEWLAARQALLAREKQHTRERDELARARLELPWVRVDKPYAFTGPSGKQSLADLFGARSQLLVYHFMFGPTWQEGCPSCSLVADHFDGTLPHLAARDVQLAVVSRAPYEKLAAFKKRMGWKFPWVSSSESDFNRDFQVSFSPEELAAGTVEYNYTRMPFPSARLERFSKDESGTVYHTYSAFARGVEPLVTTHSLLDLAPKGRDEDKLAFSMAWVRYDRYGEGAACRRRQTAWPTLPETAGKENPR
ncbi:MAG: thioredoxin family protein [Pirellulales bacterium]